MKPDNHISYPKSARKCEGTLAFTSYSQKKGRELNWQFDSRPLKVENHPNFLACRWHVTYCWKAFNKGYNFAFRSQSEVCTQNYGPPKSQESQLWEFWDSHLGVEGQNDIWALVPWLGTKYTIRGKVVASPKSRPWWILWVHVCPWLIRAPKCYNYALINLLFSLCKFVWISEVLVNLPSPISKLQHTPLPLMCYEPSSTPQLLLLSLFSPLDSYLSPSRSLGVCQ